VATLAKGINRSVRTLRNWKRRAPGEPVATPGRPLTPASELKLARERTLEQLNKQGWEVGEEPIWRALEGRVPRARVRRVLREVKLERRRAARRHARERRVSVRVLARDAIWSMDATHLGRTVLGAAVQGEVLRDAASTRSIGLSVGPQATGEEVVALLEQTVRERGGAPLVLQTDNGGAYKSDAVAVWCTKYGVLHLLNLPRTPQHNGASENGMYGLKLNAGLSDRRAVIDVDDACARLESARDRIDTHRLRRTRGWKTAVQADQDNPHWSTLVSRKEVLQKASCALEEGLLHCKGRRAERRAHREAILGTLQHFSVIQRTRGGRPWTAHNAEGET